jgi:hypothetical protein
MKVLVLAVLVLTAAVITTAAQTNVFVPGNASGCFGNPHKGCVPLTAALTVNGPGMITVTYVSGLVTWQPGSTAGPNGVDCSCAIQQLPLNEAAGVGLVNGLHKVAALIGVFVSQRRVLRNGFHAIDGTKDLTPVGIMPRIFFIGTGTTFSVSQAGTLFLGINDSTVDDNSGGFNVTVSGP